MSSVAASMRQYIVLYLSSAVGIRCLMQFDATFAYVSVIQISFDKNAHFFLRYFCFCFF